MQVIGKNGEVAKVEISNPAVKPGSFYPKDMENIYKPENDNSVFWHIDAPLRKTIAILNLLGCETAWSCCGHRYEMGHNIEKLEQAHKDHAPNYQIFMRATEKAFEVCRHITTSETLIYMGLVIELKMTPKMEPYFIVQSRPFANPNQMWGHPNSPHFHEIPNGFKNEINRKLMEMEDQMSDEVTIKDYNAFAVSKDCHWQYKPAGDWHMSKKDLDRIP